MHFILSHNDYRPIITQYIKNLRLSQKFVSDQTAIHTSYFSRVMKGSAEFSEEQLYAISQILGISGWQLEYFLTLGLLSRSGSKKHQDYVKKKLETLRREHSKVAGNLRGCEEPLMKEDISEYYREPLTSKIHMYLTISRYLENPRLLCRELNITDSQLDDQIRKLEQFGIIQRCSRHRIEMLKGSIHLDEDHPASITNHRNWRIESLCNLNSGRVEPSDFRMSAVFSCDEDTKIRIKNILKESVVKAQSEVQKSSHTTGVWYIGIDLF